MRSRLKLSSQKSLLRVAHRRLSFRSLRSGQSTSLLLFCLSRLKMLLADVKIKKMRKRHKMERKKKVKMERVLFWLVRTFV